MLSIEKNPPSMIVHQVHPLYAGPSLDVIRASFYTPQESFFIRNHGTIPEIESGQFRLAISGMVVRELELSLDELRGNFPLVTVPATLQCAGSRRDELDAARPIPGEILWSAEPISTALW